MPLNPFIRDKAYFQNIKDRGDRMKAADFDAQFNQIADYINNQILPLLNQVIIDTIPGSTAPADVNKFLRNVGDGTTQWSSIGQSAIEDYSLEFTKFSKTNPGTILAAGGDNILSEVTPQEAGQVLISVAGDKPIWRKIRSENIDDRQITAEKIALRTLTNDNFQAGVLATQVLDNTVTTVKIADGTITSNKIADGVIDLDKIGGSTSIIGLEGRSAVGLYDNILPDRFIPGTSDLYRYSRITSPNVSNMGEEIDYSFFVPGTQLPQAMVAGRRILYYGGESVRDGAIIGTHFKDNSINSPKLLYGTPNPSQPHISRSANELIADGAIKAEHFIPQYRARL